MTTEAMLSLASLALFSLADLRYRVVPGAAVFFLAAVLLSAPADPIRVGLVILAVGWGWLRWSSILIIPALLSPSTWMVLLTGAGVRQGIVGGADLLILGGIACLFDWPATLTALLGIDMWRRFWTRWRTGTVPVLPGMLLGLVIYMFFSTFCAVL